MLDPYGELAALRETPARTAPAARQNPANFPVNLRRAAEHFAASIVAGALVGLVAPEARYTGHLEVATA